jgi:hypothetical protein
LIFRASLYLDPQIRDWVLFPITLVMVRPSPATLLERTNSVTCLDLSWHSTPLCNHSFDFTTQKAFTSGHPGAVCLSSCRTFSRIYTRHSDAHSCGPRYFAPHRPIHLYPLHTTSHSLRPFRTHLIQAYTSRTVHQKTVMLPLHLQIHSPTQIKWKE